MPETDKYYVERCLDGHPDDFRRDLTKQPDYLIINITQRKTKLFARPLLFAYHIDYAVTTKIIVLSGAAFGKSFSGFFRRNRDTYRRRHPYQKHEGL